MIQCYGVPLSGADVRVDIEGPAFLDLLRGSVDNDNHKLLDLV